LQLKAKIDESKARILFTVPLLVDNALSVAGACPSLKQVVVCGKGDFTKSRDVAVYSINDMLSDGKGKPLPRLKILNSAPAVIAYTRGAGEGKQRKVTLSHRALIFNLDQIMHGKNCMKLHPSDTVLNATPDVLWMILLQNIALIRGALMVVLEDEFSITKFLKVIDSQAVTVTAVTPPILKCLLRPSKSKISSLQEIWVPGATLDVETVKSLRSITPAVIRSAYTITECGPVVSISSSSYSNDGTSVGVPISEVDVKVCGLNSDKVVDLQEWGRVFVKGPQIDWKHIIELHDGYLPTGDIGKMDEDGAITLAGKACDIFIRDGKIYAPQLVEDHVKKYTGIDEACVVSSTPEAPLVAFVVVSSKSFDDNDLLKHCNSGDLPRALHVEKVVVVEEIPPINSIVRGRLKGQIPPLVSKDTLLPVPTVEEKPLLSNVLTAIEDPIETGGGVSSPTNTVSSAGISSPTSTVSSASNEAEHVKAAAPSLLPEAASPSKTLTAAERLRMRLGKSPAHAPTPDSSLALPLPTISESTEPSAGGTVSRKDVPPPPVTPPPPVAPVLPHATPPPPTSAPPPLPSTDPVLQSPPQSPMASGKSKRASMRRTTINLNHVQKVTLEEVAILYSEVQTKDLMVEEGKVALTEAEQKLKLLDAQIEQTKQRKMNLEASLKSLTGEFDVVKLKHDTVVNELSEIQKKVDLKKSTLTSIQEKIDATRKQIKVLQTKNQASLSSVNEVKDQVTASNRNLQSKKSSLSTQVEELKKHERRLKSVHSDIESTLSSISESELLTASISKERDGYREKVAHLKSRFLRLQEERAIEYEVNARRIERLQTWLGRDSSDDDGKRTMPFLAITDMLSKSASFSVTNPTSTESSEISLLPQLLAMLEEDILYKLNQDDKNKWLHEAISAKRREYEKLQVESAVLDQFFHSLSK
jgi:acyl-coenzyme A synthetase/AMP-(fatty) acid ligase